MKYLFRKNSFSFLLISTLLLSSAVCVNDAWSMDPSEVEDFVDGSSKIIKRLKDRNAYQVDYIKADEELQKIRENRHLLSNENQTLFDIMLEDVTKRMNGTIEKPHYLVEGKTCKLLLKTTGSSIQLETNKDTKLSDLLSEIHAKTGIPIDKTKLIFRESQLVSPNLVLWNSSVMNEALLYLIPRI